VVCLYEVEVSGFGKAIWDCGEADSSNIGMETKLSHKVGV
jgi:hypothetical protein